MFCSRVQGAIPAQEIHAVHQPPRAFQVQRHPCGVSPYRLFWLVLERSQVDLCIEDPGFEVDLHVEADLAATIRVWLGDVPLETVLRKQEMQVVGRKGLVKAFPSWLMLSRFAGVPRPTHAS